MDRFRVNDIKRKGFDVLGRHSRSQALKSVVFDAKGFLNGFEQIKFIIINLAIGLHGIKNNCQDQ